MAQLGVIPEREYRANLSAGGRMASKGYEVTLELQNGNRWSYACAAGSVRIAVNRALERHGWPDSGSVRVSWVRLSTAAARQMGSGETRVVGR